MIGTTMNHKLDIVTKNKLEAFNAQILKAGWEGEIALMGNVNNQADGSKYTFSHVPESTFYRGKRTESRMSYHVGLVIWSESGDHGAFILSQHTCIAVD